MAERKEFKGSRGALALCKAGSPAYTAPGLVECLAVEPALEQLQASQENNTCQENAVRLGFRPEVRLARPEAAPGRGTGAFPGQPRAVTQRNCDSKKHNK